MPQYGFSTVKTARIAGKNLFYWYRVDDRGNTNTVVAGYEKGKPYRDGKKKMAVAAFIPPSEQESVQRRLGENIHGKIEFEFPVDDIGLAP